MRNKSLVIIISLFLFTLMSLGANMDARPLKTQALLEDDFGSNSVDATSIQQSQDITAVIEVR